MCLPVSKACKLPSLSKDLQDVRGKSESTRRAGLHRPCDSGAYISSRNMGFGSNCAPASARDHAVNDQHDDCSHHRSNQTRAFSRPVPTERLTEESRDKCSDNSQDRSEDETAWLVFTRHDELGDYARNEADYDGPKNAHGRFSVLRGTK